MTAVWAELEAGLSALFSRLAGIPVEVIGSRDGEFAFPADEDDAQTGGPVEFGFAIVRVGSRGRDELRSRYDSALPIVGDTSGPQGAAATGGVVYQQVGNRVVFVELEAEAYTQRTPAREYVERVRNSLQLPSARRELAALGLAFQGAGEVIDASHTDEHGRAVSKYVLELQLNARSGVTDEPVTTIETVETHVTVAQD